MFLGGQRRIGLTVVALAGAGCLAVSACSSGGSSTAAASGSGTGAGGAASASATATATADPLAGQSADAVLKAALANLKAASTVQMTGTLSDSGTQYTINVGVKSGQGCSGTFTTATQGSFQLIVTGKTVYLKPDDKFWKANAGAGAAAAIALVNGRYIQTTTSNKDMAGVAAMCNLAQVVSSTPASGDPVVKGAVTTADGVRVLTLKDAAKDSAGDYAYVTDTSKPQLVQITEAKTKTDGGGNLHFAVGAPVTLTAPPATQVIDGSKVGL